MKYMGSKNRIAKFIIPILLENYTEGMIFIDTCVGGANVVDKIPNHIPRFGNDNNQYLIAMYKGLVDGIDYEEIIGEITKEVYDTARDIYNSRHSDDHFSDDMVGWVGFMGSANGRFFEGGYSGISQTKIGTQRNYIDESIRGIKKQIPLLKSVVFTYGDLLYINPEKPAIIYCDIPYKGTKQYSKIKFDYERFYDWCREMKSLGHEVFVSEYQMPEDFKCIWQHEIKSSLSANGISGGNKTSIEKLFTL